MNSSYESKPWYIQKKKNQAHLLSVNIQENAILRNAFGFFKGVKITLKLFSNSIFAILCAISFTICITKVFLFSIPGKETLLYSGLATFLLFSTLFFLISQIGSVCTFFMEKKYDYSNFVTGFFYLRSRIEKSTLKKGPPAPEMILRQFLQQVRIYASERNYWKQKYNGYWDSSIRQNIINATPEIKDDSINLIQRRWNDIQDTIDEFEIYLANNPQDVISRIISKSQKQFSDVAHIFRDTAETFETTWRPKGLHIEHAIVAPLKATINEDLLKRLLVGPWRSCAYFAKRGGGVVFSAKNDRNKIIARWECHGITFPKEFYETVRNQHLSVNERIETSLSFISNSVENPNLLFGVISFIIWHDLAKSAKIDFNIEQGSEGVIVKIKV